MIKVRVGFVGCGDIATLHASAVKRCRDATLVGIWNYKAEDVSAGGHKIKVAERAKAFECKVFETVEELFGEVDAVYVLTPFEAHHLYASKALVAGKHVLVEKPVAPLESEIIELDSLAHAQGLQCVPGHNYIFEPQLRRMRELVETKRIGALVQVSIFYNIRHDSSVTARLPGIIDQIMTHHAYTCLYLTGDLPVSVSCMKTSINNGHVPHENVAMSILKMSSGALCLMQASFANDDHSSDPWSFYIKVSGTEGASRYSYNDFVLSTPDTIHSHTYLPFPWTIDQQTEHFISRCILREDRPLSSMRDALMAFRILHACKESAEKGIHVNLAHHLHHQLPSGKKDQSQYGSK